MMRAYKVRFIDVLGKEVAEFGFYENKDDARRRLLEVKKIVSMPGTMDIREIDIVPDSFKLADEFGTTVEEASFYEIKEK
jgi:hypothetical protein